MRAGEAGSVGPGRDGWCRQHLRQLGQFAGLPALQLSSVSPCMHCPATLPAPRRRELQQTEREMAEVDRAEQSEEPPTSVLLTCLARPPVSSAMMQVLQPEAPLHDTALHYSLSICLSRLVLFRWPAEPRGCRDAAADPGDTGGRAKVAGWRRALSALRVLLAEVTPRISSHTFLPPALPQYYRQTGPAKVKEVLAHIQSLLEAGE